MLAEFKKAVVSFSDAISNIVKNKLSIEEDISSKPIYDYRAKRNEYMIKNFHTSFKNLKSKSYSLTGLHDKKSEPIVNSIVGLIHMIDEYYKNKNIEGMVEAIAKIADMADELKEPEMSTTTDIQIEAKLPDEIKDEIKTDIEEIQRCFNSKCYRSAVILCGRILETVLHRKYYDVTGKDILETNPGIGLGNLIAKLKDQEVEFDPGITQQIHLVNQVRVFSVHKKQNAFKPSKDQTQAMILYTVDILKKLF